MKRILGFIIFITIVFALVSCNHHNDTSEISGRIDYPLIEYYFERGDEYLVIIYENVFTDSDAKIKILTDRDIIESIKDEFNVLTFAHSLTCN